MRIHCLLILLGGPLLHGCATTGELANPDDPYESYNRSMYAFNETVDEYVLEPVARGYKTITPDFVDRGITNFFSNLDDVLVMVNDLLQLKPINAVSDLGRILINTTIGILGFIDVATDLGIEKNNEDFGQTLAYWGYENSNYLVLPIIGPSTPRDGLGLVVDTYYIDPINQHTDDTEGYIAYGIKFIDIRADLLSATNILGEAPDIYAFTRDAWLQRRRNLIYDGDAPILEEDNLFEDDLFKDDIIR